MIYTPVPFKAYLLVFILFLVCQFSSYADPQLVQVDVGTMLWKQTESLIVFTSDAGVETSYDISAKRYLEVSGVDFPGVPGLQISGVKNSDRAFFERGSPKIVNYENIVSIVLKDENDVEYIVSAKEKTRFYRIELLLGKKRIFLWKPLNGQTKK